MNRGAYGEAVREKRGAGQRSSSITPTSEPERQRLMSAVIVKLTRGLWLDRFYWPPSQSGLVLEKNDVFTDGLLAEIYG